MDNNYLSVTELNTYLKQIIDSEDLLHRICVVGEISGLSLRGPHAYFTLKDENASLRCCCFSYTKTYVPKDGELVLLYGSIDFYHKGGYLSFNVVRIEPYGQGLIALELEKLKKRLTSLGYFDVEKKKELPFFAKDIAVITSKDGAVLHDIVRTIRAKNDVSNIDYFDVKVQGQGSAKSIIDTLKKVDKMDYDVIIIARGGGSYEDLMGFNDENLVYAIFDAKTPIVSAVGHETDVTLCDFVADLRVPTPTAAGELFAYDIAGYIENITSNIQYSYETMKSKYTAYKDRYKMLITSLMSSTKDKMSDTIGEVRLLMQELSHSMTSKYKDIENVIASNMRVLKACNPMNVLERGFFEIKDENNTHINSLDDVKVNDVVNICGVNASAKAQILKINKENV